MARPWGRAGVLILILLAANGITACRHAHGDAPAVSADTNVAPAPPADATSLTDEEESQRRAHLIATAVTIAEHRQPLPVEAHLATAVRQPLVVRAADGSVRHESGWVVTVPLTTIPSGVSSDAPLPMGGPLPDANGTAAMVAALPGQRSTPGMPSAPVQLPSPTGSLPIAVQPGSMLVRLDEEGREIDCCPGPPVLMR